MFNNKIMMSCIMAVTAMFLMTACQKEVETAPNVASEPLTSYRSTAPQGIGEGGQIPGTNNANGRLPYFINGCVLALTKDNLGNSYIYDAGNDATQFTYTLLPCSPVYIGTTNVKHMTGLAWWYPKGILVGITDAAAAVAHRNRLIYFPTNEPCKAQLGPQLKLASGAVVTDLSDIEYDQNSNRFFALRGKNRVALVDASSGLVTPLTSNVGAGKTNLRGLTVYNGEVYVENSINMGGTWVAELAKINLITGVSVTMPGTTAANRWFGNYMKLRDQELGLHYDWCGKGQFLIADMTAWKGAFGTPFPTAFSALYLSTPTMPTVDFAYIPYK